MIEVRFLWQKLLIIFQYPTPHFKNDLTLIFLSKQLAKQLKVYSSELPLQLSVSIWPSLANDLQVEVFSDISRSFHKSCFEVVLLPSCYLDMTVMAGTLAAVLDYCVPWQWRLCGVQRGSLTLECQFSPGLLCKIEVSYLSHYFSGLHYGQLKVNLAIIALRKRTHYLVMAHCIMILRKYLE